MSLARRSSCLQLQHQCRPQSMSAHSLIQHARIRTSWQLELFEQNRLVLQLVASKPSYPPPHALLEPVVVALDDGDLCDHTSRSNYCPCRAVRHRDSFLPQTHSCPRMRLVMSWHTDRRFYFEAQNCAPASMHSIREPAAPSARACLDRPQSVDQCLTRADPSTEVVAVQRSQATNWAR